MRDRFHEIYPDTAEPKLPIHDYLQLLEIMDEETAFNILCSVEDGLISVDAVERNVLND